MDTQENPENIAEKELELLKLQASVKQKELELLKYKVSPREAQMQSRIDAGNIPNVGGPVANEPAIDWKPPVASGAIPNEQTQQLFSPGQPLPPVAPAFHAGRAFDYPLVANTQVLPRSDEPISFADLKQLSNSCELVRLAIETRKGQFVKLQWNIVLRDPEARKQQDETDPRILDIEKMLRYPDGVHPFATWSAMLLDQMLIYDAPAIYPRRNRDGSLNSLMLVDGSTIKRVIDLWGRTPQATEDEPNPPAYQQIIRGVPFVNFTSDELIYWPFCPRIDHLYGLSPVEQVLVTANMFMRRQSLQLNYFTEGTLPDFFFTLPKEWTPEQIDQFAVNFYAMMQGNDAARRHGRFLPDGAKVEQTKNELLKDDFDEWLARIVCFAFSLPPTAFVRQMNRGTASQAQEAAIQEGLAPLMIWFANLMDYVIEKYFGADDLVFQWIEDEAIDPLQAAQANKIYLDAGTLTPNEVRKSLGYDPLPDMDDAFVVAGNQIVLVKDVMAGKTAPADPIELAHVQASHNQQPSQGKPQQSDKFAKRRKVERIDRNRKYVMERRQRLETLAKDALHKVMHDVLFQLKRKLRTKKLAKLATDMQQVVADLDLTGFSIVSNGTQDLLDEVYRDGAAAALVQIGVDDESVTALTNKRAIEYAKSQSADLVTQISNTTRDMLRSTVTDAMEQDWTVDKLSSAIQESAAFGDHRATMIARTEIAKADVSGNMAAYRASGVVSKKEWIIGSEHDDDDECDDNADEGDIDLDDSFGSGDDAPPSHPNCVCDVIPIVDDDGDEQE